MSIFSSRMFAWQNGQGPWGKTAKKPKEQPKTVGGGRAGNGPMPQPDIEDVVNQMKQRFGAIWNQQGSGRGFGGGTGGGTGGGMGGTSGSPLPDVGLEWIVAVVAGVWLATGFYIVAPEEQGVVTRFGAYQYTTGPGLNFHAPWPFETVIKLPVQRVNQLSVGSMNNMRAGGLQSSLPESLMLTGDQNIVDLDFTVQWRIVNPAAFLFNMANPEKTVKDVAESVMRETIGRHSIDDALTNNKLKITQEARDSLQRVLDAYGAGVRVVGLQLQQVNPPREVIDAFRDVQTANADAEKLKNEAIGYANQIVPLARGQAAKLMQEAEAYKIARVAQAEGDAARFNAQVEGYQAAPDVTRQRLYLETMQEILPDLPKVITTGKGTQGILPYLPLERLPGASSQSQQGGR